MAGSPRRPCKHRGCAELVTTGYCEKHAKDESANDLQRGSANDRGYNYAWKKAREGFLAKHPLCMCPDCKAGEKRALVATVVDHIRPHRGDKDLFWDRANWQAMSKACHDKKTATEDGGFGRDIGLRG